MARSIGMSLPAFTGIVFAAAFADLLVLGISTSPKFDPDPAQAYIVMRRRDTICRTSFRLLFQAVNACKSACFGVALPAQSPIGVWLSTRLHRM
jgi:hypothetical protein